MMNSIHSKTQRIPSSNCLEFLAEGNESEGDEFVRGLTFIMQELDLGNSVFVININQVVFDSSISYGFYRLNIRMITHSLVEFEVYERQFFWTLLYRMAHIGSQYLLANFH